MQFLTNHLEAANAWTIKWAESTGKWSPLMMVGLFLAASLLTIWRLESMSAGGLEGTVLGTVVTPYITGLGNLCFAYVIAREHGPATSVVSNCLVNNVTNMTLVLGVPAVIWKLNLLPGASENARAKKSKKPAKATQSTEVNRLSLLLTLTAVLFFTGATWALGANGTIGFNDGLVLVGLFLFWQSFHVFEVLKTNARQNKRFSWMLPIDLALLGVGGWATYLSTKWLVDWVSGIHTGFISDKHIGELSGWLDVLPNAILALYYGWTKRAEVVYTSQVGDNHICIPLCIGVFALIHPMTMPKYFQPAVFILLGATLVHFLFIAVLGRLPRLVGAALILAFVYLVWTGLLK